MKKQNLHPRNKNNGQYNFAELTKTYPVLKSYVTKNKYGNLSINYFDPSAVKALNTALLKYHYNIHWDIPNGYLTPPIPGRSDYIHYMADVLKDSNQSSSNTIPKNITYIDIGTGANCIYPIIGAAEYGWSSIGTDINKNSLDNAASIIKSNKSLQGKIQLRKQDSSNHYFKNVVHEDEYFDFSICNPPFFTSENEASKTNKRKQNNLTKNKNTVNNFNFGGYAHELWCDGGELQFIKQLMQESFVYKHSCFWFSTLVSKGSHLKSIRLTLEKYEPTEVKIIEMNQGQKTSRIIAWTFLSRKQKKAWSKLKWG